MTSIADIRKEYSQHTLNEHEVSPDPIVQFEKWWNDAVNSQIEEINAMTLATADLTGKATARTVLLKEFDNRGFVFFTNYESKKSHQLIENPQASLLFFWKELERQIRIEGSAEQISDIESDAYFQSRPLGSKIGAWASPQSRTIANRSELELEVARLNKMYEGATIPRPAHWGGFRIIPNNIEFWQGRISRLHDRILYTKMETASWKIERLAP